MSELIPPCGSRLQCSRDGSGGQDLPKTTALLLSASLGGGETQGCRELMETKQSEELEVILASQGSSPYLGIMQQGVVMLGSSVQEQFPFSECNNGKDPQAGASPHHFP